MLVFFCTKLLYSDNIFKLLLWVFLLILLLTGYLFIFQLDVFACFLVVSETVVIFFVLSFIIHINHTNINLSYKSSFIIYPLFFILPLVYVNFNYIESVYSYYIDWFVSSLSSYNDLLSQYIYLYSYSNGLILIIGSWLLLLTFLIVIILSLSPTTVTNNNFINKRQSLWVQWFRKPYLRFFK